MTNRTLQMRPSQHGYVSVEADTFRLWSILLQYRENLDPARPIHVCSPMLIGETVFAHGGLGSVVSDLRWSRPSSIMRCTKKRSKAPPMNTGRDIAFWGRCFFMRSLTRACPAFRGDCPCFLSYTPADRLSVADKSLREWCSPSVSYRYMAPSDIEEL